MVGIGRLAVLFAGVASAGGDWKSVWLEPHGPVLLTVGATQRYTAMGRSGAHTKSDLTQSPHLDVRSSNPDAIAVDQSAGSLIGRNPGHAHVLLSFSGVKAMVPVFVRKRVRTSDGADGVWMAVFTGDDGARPKMVTEIFFDLNAAGAALTGTVHAAYWPGDAPISEGRIDGNRVSFVMHGRSPFQANGVTGYPKLCFSGIRAGSEMKIDLEWTEERLPCADGRTLPMRATKLMD